MVTVAEQVLLLTPSVAVRVTVAVASGGKVWLPRADTKSMLN